MKKKPINNIKLGAFIVSGLLFLVLLLYMIGKNQHLFGNTYILKANFDNVHGLVKGNNVRYAGIQAGTVKDINILNDTTIEVVMVIDIEMLHIIRTNATVTVGTEGLVGNKTINIMPARQTAPFAKEGDHLLAQKSVDTNDMLQTLAKTNNDIALIASELKNTIQHINSSKALWELLNDKSLPKDLKIAAAHIRSATAGAYNIAKNLQSLVVDINAGKGSAGILLKDSAFAVNLNSAAIKVKSVGLQADSLIANLRTTLEGLEENIENGKGLANAIFKDSALVQKIAGSLDNIQKGTDGFNQNMEALKHNFLFRSYFKKLEKEKKKASKVQK